MFLVFPVFVGLRCIFPLAISTGGDRWFWEVLFLWIGSHGCTSLSWIALCTTEEVTSWASQIQNYQQSNLIPGFQGPTAPHKQTDMLMQFTLMQWCPFFQSTSPCTSLWFAPQRSELLSAIRYMFLRISQIVGHVKPLSPMPSWIKTWCPHQETVGPLSCLKATGTSFSSSQ